MGGGGAEGRAVVARVEGRGVVVVVVFVVAGVAVDVAVAVVVVAAVPERLEGFTKSTRKQQKRNEKS